MAMISLSPANLESIAKALKNQQGKVDIIAFDIDKESLLLAQTENIASVCYDELDEVAARHLGNCDILFSHSYERGFGR